MNKPKFFVSLLKAFWGDAAQSDNEFAYHYLPKIGKGYQGSGYSWLPLFESMAEGGIKGMLVWGMNPAVGSSNLNQTYVGLDKLEWLANFDLWETDTSVFWKRPGANPKDKENRLDHDRGAGQRASVIQPSFLAHPASNT